MPYRGDVYKRQTFTIIRVDKNGHVYMAEFDNPNALHYRDGKLQEIERESRNIDGKEVLISTFQAQPVSYTHLDVYKRQGTYWEATCLILPSSAH